MFLINSNLTPLFFSTTKIKLVNVEKDNLSRRGKGNSNLLSIIQFLGIVLLANINKNGFVFAVYVQHTI